MRISIPIEVKAEGGGNYFISNFLRYLDSHGIVWSSRLDFPCDVIFTSHWKTSYLEVLAGVRYNPYARIVHRVDGAAQDYGRYDEADAIQCKVNSIADLTIFQSRYSRYSTRSKFPVIGQDGPIIYNPVDVDTFSPYGPQIKFDRQVVVASVTWSTNPMKGWQEVYEVARNHPNVGFALCGRFPDPPDLANIYIMGVLGRSELAAVLRSCTALLTLSRNEACPNVVIEALACGLPVLYRNSGATSELVNDCGYAVEIGSFGEMLDRTLERRAELSALARSTALSRFHPDVVFSQYLTEIERALDSPPRLGFRRRQLLVWNPLNVARWLLESRLRSLRPHLTKALTTVTGKLLWRS